MTEEVWGILGGAGPRAGVRLLQQVWAEAVRQRGGPLRADADYPAVVLDTRPLPGIGSEGPTHPERVIEGLAQVADRLEAMGATRLLLACVSAHPYLAAVPRPERFVDLRARGLSRLAQAPACYTAVLECAGAKRALETDVATAGVPLIPLPVDRQATVDALIHHGMAGTEASAVEIYETLANHLIARGARRLVWGCSDLAGWAPHIRARQALPVYDLLAEGVRDLPLMCPANLAKEAA